MKSALLCIDICWEPNNRPCIIWQTLLDNEMIELASIVSTHGTSVAKEGDEQISRQGAHKPSYLCRIDRLSSARVRIGWHHVDVVTFVLEAGHGWWGWQGCSVGNVAQEFLILQPVKGSWCETLSSNDDDFMSDPLSYLETCVSRDVFWCYNAHHTF